MIHLCICGVAIKLGDHVICYLVIDVEVLLMDQEENLKLEQIKSTHPGILDLLGDPGSPLYGEPLSMREHFNVMIVGADHLRDLPK